MATRFPSRFDPTGDEKSCDEIIGHARLWFGIGGLIELVEISCALIAFGGMLWELLRTDRGMAGMVGFWLVAVALVAVILRRTPPDLRAVSTLYLAMLWFGSWLAQQLKILPGFSGEHPGRTDFAAKWNQMSIASRRLGTWNGFVTVFFFFFLIGYVAFWMELRRHRDGYHRKLSSFTCVAGLIVVWGLPALAAFSLLMSLFQ